MAMEWADCEGCSVHILAFLAAIKAVTGVRWVHWERGVKLGDKPASGGFVANKATRFA